jgi:elongation factor Ts
MAFTAKDVANLRERTGCGMMDCKKALVASDGDVDKAIEFLREKGLAAVAKKAGRIASEGVVTIYNDGKVAAMVEVNSETDFVAKNADFIAFCKEVAEVVAKTNPADVDDLKTKAMGDMTVADVLQEKVLTIGENLSIRRFYRTERPAVDYVHGGGKIGVLTEFETDCCSCNEGFVTVGKDVCMQITAMNPQFLDQTAVDPEVVAKEKAIIMAQIKEDPKNASKPDNIIEKMVGGKINKFYEQNCLLQQEFCVNPDFKVEAYLASKGVKLVDYVRFEKGEGLEKREDNFADEVASMVK